MSKNKADSKYLVLWICVILTATVIFAGWFFALKQNFVKINAQMQNEDGRDIEQMEQELTKTFQGLENILKKQELADSEENETEKRIKELEKKVDDLSKNNTEVSANQTETEKKQEDVQE
ncbi:MAG TPA: hypothetical protein VKP03_01970 [Patescibacteria group bacterium]|nr:hypothetical protein [Patescibacteria group bacterium]